MGLHGVLFLGKLLHKVLVFMVNQLKNMIFPPNICCFLGLSFSIFLLEFEIDSCG